MVPLLDIIPLGVLNKSYYSKNRSASSTAVIIIKIVKYPKNFIYLLIITRIVLATSLVLILVGGCYGTARDMRYTVCVAGSFPRLISLGR